MKKYTVKEVREITGTPKTINSIFGEKPYDRMKLLDDIIANAKKKVEELNNIIIVAEQLKFLGVEGWGINLLNPKNLNADFKELVKVFADKIRSKKNSDNYRITLQAAMEMTSEAEKEFVRLLKGFANLKDQYPEADLILQHLETFENFLQTHLHLKVPQQMLSLAIGLDGTGEIAASIDALAEKGTAKYISDILSAKYLTHLDNTVNNFLENLEFEVDQSPDDEAVQESIGQLKNIYQTYFEFEDLDDFRHIACIHGLDPAEFEDEAQEGLAFLTRAIEIYCKREKKL